MRRGLTAAVLAWVVVATAAPVSAQSPIDVTKIYLNNTSTIFESSGAIRLNANGNVIGPENGYEENLGELTKKYLTLHAAELWVETLVAQNTIATIGGRILVGPTTVLVQDLAAAGTTIHVKHNQMASGDRTYMEADGKVEFFAITSSASSHSGHFDYTVTRNLDSSGANDWFAGDAMFNTGQTGNGWWDVYSVRGVKTSTEIGPTIVANIRNSSTFNDWSPRGAIGRLDGLYGYTSTSCGGSPCFGSVFGVASGARITMDPTNGIRIFDGTNDERVTITPAGNAIFDGKLTVGTGRNVLRNSECRVGTESWSGATNSGLTFSLNFALSPWRLNDESNTCYMTVTGTPANGTVSEAVYADYFPVVVGTKYEASAYMGVHRATSGELFVFWYNSSFVFLSATATSSPTCTQSSAGGATLAGYCRTGIIGTAPASATYARLVIRTTYNGLEVDPFLFFVRMYFGEASPEQTTFTEWGGAGTTEITGGLIKTDAVDARIIAADTITANEIAANAITTSELNADAVTSAKIAANTIVAADIAANTITANEIAANAITTSELDADSVTSAKIAANTITAADIAADTITANEIATFNLSSISANLGTVTAGTLTAVTIDGATIVAGAGDEVQIDNDGILIEAGTDAPNAITWTDGNSIFSSSGEMRIGGSSQVTLYPSAIRLENGTFAGVGGNRFVCHDNDGDLYSSATTCDGSEPAAEIAALQQEVGELRQQVAELRSLLRDAILGAGQQATSRQSNRVVPRHATWVGNSHVMDDRGTVTPAPNEKNSPGRMTRVGTSAQFTSNRGVDSPVTVTLLRPVTAVAQPIPAFKASPPKRQVTPSSQVNHNASSRPFGSFTARRSAPPAVADGEDGSVGPLQAAAMHSPTATKNRTGLIGGGTSTIKIPRR